MKNSKRINAFFINEDGNKETDIELQQKYNPEGSILRNAQLVMLDMLLYLDKICKENKIEYYLSDGNLLGAVRHKGFIPWDDDTDISMSTKNLKKLSKILLSPEHKNDRYILQCHRTDKGYFSFNYVLRDKYSEYIQNSRVHNARQYKGIQIDIFPYTQRKVFSNISSFIFKFEILNMKLFIGRNSFFANLTYYFESLLIHMMKFISFVMPKTKYFECDYTYWFHYKYEYSKIFPLSEIEFEGHSFPCPNDCDYYLRTTYNDEYMTLPSINNRDKHEVKEIIFNYTNVGEGQ